MPGKSGDIITVRWPQSRIDAINKVADGNRSKWIGEAVDARLVNGGDTLDPLAALAALAPAVAAWLETCSMEDRALARGSLELMAKAFSARATGKAPR